MILRDFLTKYGKIGEIVIIREGGWQIGMTRIDNEDLYLHSLNPLILDDYEVVHFATEQRDWAIVSILVLDILPSYATNV